VFGTLLAGVLPVSAAEKTNKGGTALFVSAADAKWVDVPNMKGIQMATIKGDPQKGPAHFLVKFQPGVAVPLHHHTADHNGTIISGMMVFTSNSQEQKLPAGSYFSFTGKAPHTTACAEGTECIIMIDTHAKWDVVPEEKPAASSKT
jgi:quercetin dioxygenase-like cupin family protein